MIVYNNFVSSHFTGYNTRKQVMICYGVNYTMADKSHRITR